MNPNTISGIVAGIVVGFFLGRFWAEYFRARAVGQQAQTDRRNYRGRSAAWYAGALLILGGAILYGHLVPT